MGVREELPVREAILDGEVVAPPSTLSGYAGQA